MSEEKEKKVLEVDFKDGELLMSADSNKDGEKVLDLKVNLSEAVQEVLNRGEALEGAKLLEFDFSLSKLVLKIDTDKDGEKLLDISIDLAELLDEVGLS